LVGAAVDESSDAGVDQRAGAHGARFERDDERAVVQPPRAEDLDPPHVDCRPLR
jgi:hypothetical protein